VWNQATQLQAVQHLPLVELGLRFHKSIQQAVEALQTLVLAINTRLLLHQAHRQTLGH
jgi:hypothetical protein